MTKYIPIHEYAKKKGVKSQNVYRWIRERKISPDRVKVEKITVERLRIDEKAVCPK